VIDDSHRAAPALPAAAIFGWRVPHFLTFLLRRAPNSSRNVSPFDFRWQFWRKICVHFANPESAHLWHLRCCKRRFSSPVLETKNALLSRKASPLCIARQKLAQNGFQAPKSLTFDSRFLP
jgi:hypothetical protein